MKRASVAFASRLMHECLIGVTERNCVYSPLGIQAALFLLLEGAGEEAARFLLPALNLPQGDPDTIAHQCSQWLASCEIQQANAVLALASSVYTSPDIVAEQGYKKRLHKRYRGSWIEPTPNVGLSADRINAWVKHQTRGLIHEIIESDLLDSVSLVLLNAVYFKAKWKYEFDDWATHDAPFRLAGGGGVTCSLMSLGPDMLRYIQTPEFEAVALPYLDGRTSMVVVLPPEVDGLDEMIRRLDLSRLLEGLVAREVKVSLPKFDVQSGANDLTGVLHTLGLGNLLDANSSPGLTRLARTEPPLSIEKAIQKAVVRVNEQGTEAAAATMIAALCYSAESEEIPRFIADRPFLYFIHDAKTDAVTFIGRIDDPS